MEIKKNMELIHQFLKSEEGEQLDFKQSINKSPRIAKTLVAFANTQGGKILVGVSDNKKIMGIDPEEEMYMINKANREYCVPPVHCTYEIFEIDYLGDQELEEEIYILLVNVSKSTKQHAFRGHDGKLLPYQRIADMTKPI